MQALEVMKSSLPKITFGIIVLNGEPFTLYNLRSIYPFAHQIIVVEGACPAAQNSATFDGHSKDGTLEILRQFKEQEDTENKVTIVTAEDEGYENGFWPGEKDEQSKAYAKRVTGDWLWQVDIDEFYRSEDILWICEHLLTQPDLSTVSFEQIQFWGGLNYHTNGWYLQYYGGREFHRLFRWKPGYQYISHRPPTVVNEKKVDLRHLVWLRGKKLARHNIWLYHYSFLFPDQVEKKSNYYSRVDWGAFSKMTDWAAGSYTSLARPYHVHNVYRYPSWLERYNGNHPSHAVDMWNDVKYKRTRTQFTLRTTHDIERILESRRYQFGIKVLNLIGPLFFYSKQAAFRITPRSVKTFLKRMFNTVGLFSFN